MTFTRGNVIDDQSEGNYERRMKEAESALKTHDVQVYSTLAGLKEHDGMSAFREYKEALSNKVKEIQAMQGPLYTDQGKANLIREEAEKMATEYLEKADAIAERKFEEVCDMGRSLTRAIDEEKLSNDQLAAMGPMEAKAKTDLSFARNPEQVRKAYKYLVERGENDRASAKFAAMYGYLFLDRMKEFGEGEQTSSYIGMQALFEQAKEYSYSEEVRAKIFIKDHFEEQNAFRLPDRSASITLINMELEGIKRKFK